MVRVHAASVNPADLKVVSGKDGGRFLHAGSFPTAFGFDFSGVIEDVGPQAEGVSAGDEVFGHLAYSFTTKQGSFSELVSVDPATIGPKPPNVSHEEAAASATVGLTALQGLRDYGRLQAGQRVLVNGASGGVGSYAVQIARQLHAEVWGTSSASKASFVRELGVEHVIDYRQTPVSSIGERFDLFFDAASKSSFRETRGLLNPGGSYVTLLPSPALVIDLVSSFFSSKRATAVTVKSKRADLEQLGRWLDGGEVLPHVQRSFPLEQLGKALELLDTGSVKGKLAITVGS